MIWGFVTAAVVTTILVPLVIRLLRQWVLDVPNHRSGHSVPTPRGGGVACSIGVVAGAFAAQQLGNVNVPWLGLGIVGLIAGVGFLDDLVNLSPVLRLGIQLVTGGVLGWWFGNVAYIVAGVVVLTWLVNVTNFMDGINGLTAGISILWGIVAWWSGDHYHVVGLALIGALAAGIGLGFLPWNFPKARTFIGDVGAYLLGALYAVGILISAQKVVVSPEAFFAGDVRATAISLAPLLIYLADTSWTILRRIVRGDNPMEPHREFTFHRLVDGQGWPHWLMTSIIVGLSTLGTLAVIFLPDVWAVVVATAVVLCYLALPALLSDNATRLAHARTSETHALHSPDVSIDE